MKTYEIERPSLFDQRLLLAAALALLIAGIVAALVHPTGLSGNAVWREGGSLLAPLSNEGFFSAIGDPNAPPPAQIAPPSNGSGDVTTPPPEPSQPIPPPPPAPDGPSIIEALLNRLPPPPSK